MKEYLLQYYKEKEDHNNKYFEVYKLLLKRLG
jgi:hypothetical protein